MSFAVFTDSCSNLPGSLLQHFGIRVLPCSYTVDGKQIIYGGDIEAFDAHTYYELLRQGKRVTTSLLNTQVFLDHFRPALEQGLDVVYVGCLPGSAALIKPRASRPRSCATNSRSEPSAP